MVSTRKKIKTELTETILKEDVKNEYASSIMENAGEFNSYQEMVEAKRKRNMEKMKSLGLLKASAELKHSISNKNNNNNLRRGIKRNIGKTKLAQVTRRTSSRIRGVRAANLYVEHESGGRITIGGNTYVDGDSAIKNESITQQPKEFYRGRVNDGSDLSVKEAVELSGSKWVKENSVESAENFVQSTFSSKIPDSVGSMSPTSVALESNQEENGESFTKLASQVSELSINHEYNDKEESIYSPVVKVVPDRIYAMSCHPSESKLIACAGDKRGHIGFWHVNHDSTDNDSDGVHLFKPHSGAVNNLDWNKNGTSLFSTSYDGTVRKFDCGEQTFREVFATYDDSDEYRGKLGYGIDEGYHFYLQYGCLDHRNDDCMFLSTSFGGVMHIDLRANSNKSSNAGGLVTFNESLSHKKINTVSLHPDGRTLATAGLDCTVKLWDLRMMGSKTKKSKKISQENYNLSVNSAFFSPSGKSLMSVTMTNHIHITHNAHLQKSTFEPTERLLHNNKTGRWLTTFRAEWHPTKREDIFVIGCMKQPRRIEIFDSLSTELLGEISGDGLTAVASRCCFHPSEKNLIVFGGNSSGRVTVSQSR